MSNNKRGSRSSSYFDPATSHKADVSLFTMSPTIRAFRAQLLRGDLCELRLAGPSTATGRPRRVMVMGSPNCSISPRQAKHLALNSDALKTRSFMISMITDDMVI